MYINAQPSSHQSIDQTFAYVCMEKAYIYIQIEIEIKNLSICDKLNMELKQKKKSINQNI